ncbi:hypothetical protein P2318_19075 [Myxococcaceae bacterium GXIMD 01537]
MKTRILPATLVIATLSLTASARPSAPAPQAHADHGGHAHAGHAHGAAGSYKAELAAPEGGLIAGREAALRFTVKDPAGAVVRDLPLVHEKPLHLLVVSRDLRDFYHLHPEPRPDGTYQVSHTFPSGGDYLAFLDYTPKGSAQVVDRIALSVKGAPRAKAALQADATSTRTVDGLRVAMTSSKPPRASEGLVLQFSVTDAASGKPVTDLQPYLGAMAHFVILSEDTKDFLHAHPLESGTAPGGSVSAHTEFPRAGLYKVWTQVQRNGRIVTIPFVLQVR